LGLVEDGVGEKRTRAAGVRVGAVEHHPLAPAQVQHGLGRQLQGGVLARSRPRWRASSAIAQRPAAVGARQAHHHLGHHVADRPLKRAVAVDKPHSDAAQLAAAVTGTVQTLTATTSRPPPGRKPRCSAPAPRRPGPVYRSGTRCRTDLRHAEADECRPVLARSGPDQRPGTVGLNGYTFYRTRTTVPGKPSSETTRLLPPRARAPGDRRHRPPRGRPTAPPPRPLRP